MGGKVLGESRREAWERRIARLDAIADRMLDVCADLAEKTAERVREMQSAEMLPADVIRAVNNTFGNTRLTRQHLLSTLETIQAAEAVEETTAPSGRDINTDDPFHGLRVVR